MSGFFQLLQSQPFFAIFGVVALGMALGKVAVKGIALGSVVCIVLVGLVVSIASYRLTGAALQLPDVLKTVFFNLFIFAIGVKIGPQFFCGLERGGWSIVAIGLIVAVLAPLSSWLCAWIFDLPQGALAGLLAGSNNSSATFGAASSALQSDAVTIRPGGSIEQITGTLSAAFALCYAVAQVQYVLFMKWLPGLARIDAPAEALAFESTMRAEHAAPPPGTVEAQEIADRSLAVRAYRLSLERVAGHTIGEIRAKAPRVSVELVRRGRAWIELDASTTLEPGDEVVVAAPLDAHALVRAALGPELPDAEARATIPMHTVDVVIGRAEAVGHPLPELLARLGPGLYPNAVFRAGEEVPIAATELKKADVIRVTGTEPHIAELGAKVGQVIRASHVSDVLTLAIGLLIGAAVGAVPLPLGNVSVSLGAAAVLMTGILFGWLKTRHPALGGPISEGARQLLEVLGLNVFTSVLALSSGLAVYGVIVSGPIWSLIASCLVVSAVPAIIAWLVGRHLLGLNPALLMGAVAGARQCTSALQAAQDETKSTVPGIGYPVPLAIATVALSVVGYVFAIFG